MANGGFRSRSAAIAPNQLDHVIADEQKKPCSQSVYETGADGGSTGQVVLPVNAAAIVKFRNVLRRGIKVTNLGTNDVFIGFSQSVNAITGDLLSGTKGNFIVIPSTLDIWAFAASGATLSYLEIFDTEEGVN